MVKSEKEDEKFIGVQLSSVFEAVIYQQTQFEKSMSLLSNEGKKFDCFLSPE